MTEHQAGRRLAGAVGLALLAGLLLDGGAIAAEGAFSIDALGGRPNERADSAEAVRKAVREAVRAGGGTIRFGAGTYYMMTSPTNAYAVWPKDAKDIHIRGVKGKTQIVVTDPHIGLLRFDRCTNCSVRDLIVDYETPPFTQGTITAVDVRAGTFDLKIDKGFPALDEPFFSRGNEWGLPMDRLERRPKYVGLDHIWIRDWRKVDEGIWRLFCRNRHNARALAVGDRYVQLARQTNHGVFGVWRSSRITMEDVTVHASAGITNGVVMSDAVVYRRFQVRFRKGTDRLITSNGDGIHVHGSRRGPVIEDCLFEGICDDGINLNSHMSPIVRVVRDSEIVVQPGAVTFRAGDRIQVFDPDAGTIKGQASVTTVGRPSRGRVALKLAPAIRGLKPNTSLAADRPRRERRIRGPRRTDGDVVYNLSCGNAGFVIRRNTFRHHRRHGLLIRSGAGLIERNTFDHTCGLGIVIENGAPLEGPIASDVTVRNNTLIGVGQSRHYGASRQCGAIMVRTNRSGHRLAPGRAIRNVRILHNTVRDPCRYAVYVGSATGVTIAGNHVTAARSSTGFGRSAGVCVENAAGVVVRDLTYADPRASVEAGVVIRRSVDPGEAGVVLTGLTLKLPAGTPDLLDQRDQPTSRARGHSRQETPAARQ